MAGNFTLAGIIHKPFYYKRGYAAATISVRVDPHEVHTLLHEKPSIGQIRDEPG